MLGRRRRGVPSAFATAARRADRFRSARERRV